MPTYGYECTLCNEEFEVWQRITEEPLKRHEGCGGELRRRVYPAGIVFKGPGFHVNDYAPKRNGNGSKSADVDSSAKSDTKSEAKTAETASAK